MPTKFKNEQGDKILYDSMMGEVFLENADLMDS